MASEMSLFDEVREAVKKQREFEAAVTLDEQRSREFWSPLFFRYFMEYEDDRRDDMIYLVPSGLEDWPPSPTSENEEEEPHFTFTQPKPEAASKAGSSPTPTSKPEPYAVVRRTNGWTALPYRMQRSIQWHETFCLNFLASHFDYSVNVIVCENKTRTQDWKLIKKIAQKVYALPSAQRMDVKGEQTKRTYPLIFFSVSNFDSLFQELVLCEGRSLIIKLIGRPLCDVDKDGRKRPPLGRGKALFQGRVDYSALLHAFASEKHKQRPGRLASKAHKEAVLTGQPAFITLRGPNNTGKAQVAINMCPGEVARLRTISKDAARAKAEAKANNPDTGQAWTVKKAAGQFQDLMNSIQVKKPGLLEAKPRLNSLLTFVHLHWSDLMDLLL